MKKNKKIYSEKEKVQKHYIHKQMIKSQKMILNC